MLNTNVGQEHNDVFKHAKALLMFTHLAEVCVHHSAIDIHPLRHNDLLSHVLPKQAFGLVTIEALAKGTPVFGSTKGANPDLITSEVGFMSDDIEVNLCVDQSHAADLVCAHHTRWAGGQQALARQV
jgi:glycosyltransferase involved in cell wall biosynthesis